MTSLAAALPGSAATFLSYIQAWPAVQGDRAWAHRHQQDQWLLIWEDCFLSHASKFVC